MTLRPGVSERYKSRIGPLPPEKLLGSSSHRNRGVKTGAHDLDRRVGLSFEDSGPVDFVDAGSANLAGACTRQETQEPRPMTRPF
jgi:hypothetical protein